MMSNRENVLKAIRFERPEQIPMVFHINPACWHHYDQEVLQDLMEEHRLLFPDFQRQRTVRPMYALNQRKDQPHVDPWGCVWETMDDGITGSVHRHPLADWNNFASYRAPDPALTDGTFPIDWHIVEDEVAALRARGSLVYGGLPHGHTFLRLVDIRGYERLLLDMMDGHAGLASLIDTVEEFNAGLVLRWMNLHPDVMQFPEDLGMQEGPMLSPDLFLRYIKPVYQRLMKPARDAGCIVHMHSDGDIRTLVDDLVDGGVDVINLQDLVNGIDWIAQRLAGRVCIDLDIDRQSITASGTPRQIDELIREEVRALGSREGGLMMIYGLYPGVPRENVRALMDAMERYATYYA
jgi:uroporphyrinogen decarboxylase